MSRQAKNLKIKYHKPKKSAGKPVISIAVPAKDQNLKKPSSPAGQGKSPVKMLQIFRENKKPRIILIILLFVIVFAAGIMLGSFLTGIKKNADTGCPAAVSGNNVTPGAAVSPALTSPLPKIVISGKVTAITTLQIEVTDADGIPYNLGYNSMSVLISPQDTILTFSELKSGDNVTVRANRSPEGNLTAERVKILAP
jgi:hypothetical protein